MVKPKMLETVKWQYSNGEKAQRLKPQYKSVQEKQLAHIHVSCQKNKW